MPERVPPDPVADQPQFCGVFGVLSPHELRFVKAMLAMYRNLLADAPKEDAKRVEVDEG